MVRPCPIVVALTLASGLALLAPAAALAQPASQRASALNDEGKSLFAAAREAGSPAEAAGLYERAHAKFAEAASISPEGRFYFNMCFTLNFLERYQEAIAACEKVQPNGADAALIEKTNNALASLRQKAASRPDGGGPTDPGPGAGGSPTDPGGGASGGPTDPGAGGGGPGPVGAGGDPFVVSAAGTPDDAYQWSLGGEIGGLSNRNLGADGIDRQFADQGFSLRLFADFIVSPARRFGVQAYLALSELGPGTTNIFDERLTVLDLGGALFKSFRLGKHLFVRPLGGAHISVQQLETGSEGFVAVGLRLEGSVGYLFGASSEHAITATIGLNGYSAASGSSSAFLPEDFNLDKASATASLGIGYQYRFSTPFGSSPLITLE